MTDTRRLVLWRHGRTSWNVENRFQGHTDIDLDDVGVAQAARAASVLASVDPELVVSSDLSRARVTAQALADLVGARVDVDPGLRETSGGEWEGRTGAELRAEASEDYLHWLDGADLRPGRTGDSRTEVADRAEAAALRALDRVTPGRTVVLVSHGGTMRALIGRLLGLPVPQWSVLGGLGNCCWSVLAEVPQGAADRGARGVHSPGEDDAVTGAGTVASGAARWRLLEHNVGVPAPVEGRG